MSTNSNSKLVTPIPRIFQLSPSLEVLPELEENYPENGKPATKQQVDRKFQGKESILSSQISLYVEETSPKIPDGGWGWFVVAAAFYINILSEGLIFSFGLLYIVFLDEFGASKSATSWIGSLFMAVPLLSGPIASAFVDKYGCKYMTMVGGIICTVGFILSSFARSIGVMYVTFGVIGGLGKGLSYVTAVVSLAFWFEKRRTFVLGLAASGAGFGTMVFSPLSTFLLFEFGWRGTVMIFAGLFFNLCVCGMLMRNPDWVIEEEKRDRKQKVSDKIVADKKDSLVNKELPVNGENQLLLHKIDTSNKDRPTKNRIQSEVNLPTYLKQNEKVPMEVVKQLREKKDMYNMIVDNYPNLVGSKNTSDRSLHSSSEHNKTDNKEAFLLRRNSERDRRRSRSHSHSYLRNIRYRKNSIGCRNAMLNIHKYHITASSCPDVYRNTVVQQENQEEEKWYVEYLDILRDLTHFSLFLELHFLMLSLSTIILFIWFIVPYFYLADLMTMYGYTENEATFVLSIIGLTNTIGMVLLGWVGDRLNVAKTYAACLIITGVCVGFMMFFINNYIMLVTSSALFGLFFASCFSLTPALLAELVSLEDFTMAYGLVLLCDGIGNLTGPPLAGMLFDITQSWDQSFYQAAFWIIISGVLIIIIPYTKNRKLCGSGLTLSDQNALNAAKKLAA